MPHETAPRLNYYAAAPELFGHLMKLSNAVHAGLLGPTLIGLVDIRASQINGCTFCVDMHVKQARQHGERELRLHHIAVWRESNLFDDRERAVLTFTEAVTRLGEGGVSDAVWAETKQHFNEAELTQLIVAIGVINLWNRISVTVQAVHGSFDKQMGLDKVDLH